MWQLCREDSGACLRWNATASAAVVVACAASPALAQIGYRLTGEATWWWEASADNGQTWVPTLLEVPSTQSVVKVRASVAFPPDRWHYFLGAWIDQTITGVNGAGLNDTVFVTDPGFNNQQTLASRRFGNVLKIDDVSDTAPPGEGPAQWAIGQPGFSAGPWTYANPVIGVIDFNLSLDGSEGDRLVSAWWRDWSVLFPNDPVVANLPPTILVANNNPFTGQDFILPTLTINDLTIRVVPAPGVAVLFATACAFAGVRRARSVVLQGRP